jgi:hypothetical protein
VLGLLERFGGYTYETLMAEDCGLLRMLKLEELGGSRDVSSSSAAGMPKAG